MSNPLSALPDLTKESNIHQDQVISPLTQSAQRFPFYVRDSIMTPRCRKPVFTFSPIDEPADDLVPNSDTLQLANMIHPPSSSVQESNKLVDEVIGSEATCSEATSSEATCSEATSSEATCSELTSSEATSSEKENMTEDNSSDISLTEDSENSILSGCTLIQESKGSLTSPFKKYLMERDIQILDESVQQGEDTEELTTDPSLLESEKPISDSLIEFLDGQEQSTESFPHSSPTRHHPSPPLTKSILFETSL